MSKSKSRPIDIQDPKFRARVAKAIEGLMALLDATESPSDADPIFPGHPAYQVPPIDWSRTAAGSSVDPETEPDNCDDEEDDPGEENGDREVDENFGNGGFAGTPISTIFHKPA